MRTVEPVTDDEVRELARELVRGRVYGTWNVPLNMLSMVFVPVMLGGLAGLPEEMFAKISVFAIHGTHKTTGMAINGFPTFVEVRVWLTSDIQRAMDLANKILDAEKAVLDQP